MPPELVVDQALMLKKRARRRLVGATALVIIMLIILPNVLKDQSALQERAPIKLSMPEPIESEVDVQEEIETSAESAAPAISTSELPENINLENNAAVSTASQIESPKPSPAQPKAMVNQQSEKIIVENSNIADVKSKAKKNSVAQTQAKKTNIDTPNKLAQTIAATPKPQRFLIQVGVYSDEANVKQLQLKIADAGFTSHTAKLQTAKGEKIRLRVGSFVTREAAAEALKKIQASGLSGMVLIDE